MLDPDLRRRMDLTPVSPAEGQTYEQALELAVTAWCYIARTFLDWDGDIDRDALRAELDRITREARQRTTAVRRAVERLPDGQRSVLERRMAGAGFAVIAADDGVDPEAVRQVEAEAVNDLMLLVDLARADIRAALGLPPAGTHRTADPRIAALGDLEPRQLGLSNWTRCVLADEGVLTMHQLLRYAFDSLAEIESDPQAVADVRRAILGLLVPMDGSVAERLS